MVEQLLTTGGGWQDQVGCLYPGIKKGFAHQHLFFSDRKMEKHFSKTFALFEISCASKTICISSLSSKKLKAIEDSSRSYI